MSGDVTPTQRLVAQRDGWRRRALSAEAELAAVGEAVAQGAKQAQDAVAALSADVMKIADERDAFAAEITRLRAELARQEARAKTAITVIEHASSCPSPRRCQTFLNAWIGEEPWAVNEVVALLTAAPPPSEEKGND